MKKSIRQNIGEVFLEAANALETGVVERKTRVGVTILGSEHGPTELLAGAELAQSGSADLEVVVIGSGVETSLEVVEAADEKEVHVKMDQLLEEGSLDAAVTMHYNFPIGVSTVGRVVTPARGKKMFLATTTGTSATGRVIAMLRNALLGIAVAKSCGLPEPTLGILNIDGSRQVERSLKELSKQGYPLRFAESGRNEAGVLMRGNDLLQGVPDVMVTDSLTGNVLMKVFSAFHSGGSYEAMGFGYGPGVGDDYDRIICIISRASGAPVIAGAIRYARECARGKLLEKARQEFAAAKKAGWDKVLESLTQESLKSNGEPEGIAPPPPKPVSDEIPGIDILQLEDAVRVLWKSEIYASSGMGCTGPVILVAPEDKPKSLQLLQEAGYL